MKEADIRPRKLLEEYLRLSSEDARTYFRAAGRDEISCPACGSDNSRFSFEKSGFSYRLCKDCCTLFQSPRPNLQEFENFYFDSPSSRFWSDTFFPAVAENRRSKIFVPRVEKIASYCADHAIDAALVMDIGAGHGIFLEEWRRRFPTARVCAIEPGTALAGICRQKNIEVLEAVAEKATEWHGRADLLTCFEVIEHVHDPLNFLRSLRGLMKKNGHAVVTGLGVDGFDIQVLWEQSQSVAPPHHINFMSVDGFKQLFARAGFTNINLFTPGLLDVDIVANAFSEDKKLADKNPFVAQLLRRGSEARKDFQNFLQKHSLSSHVWVVASIS